MRKGMRGRKRSNTEMWLTFGVGFFLALAMCMAALFLLVKFGVLGKGGTFHHESSEGEGSVYVGETPSDGTAAMGDKPGVGTQEAEAIDMARQTESAVWETKENGEEGQRAESASATEPETVSRQEAVSGTELETVSGSEAASSEEEKILENMTLEEKVYQLFIVYPSAITGVQNVTAAGETTRKALEKYPVGGFFYNKSNMISKEQILEMLTGAQEYSRIPLLLICDEEGGRVSKMRNIAGTTRVRAMLNYKDMGQETAEKNAFTMASDLASCGFNMDFAPVADVWSNPNNTVIGDRAYSDDFQQAAELIPAAVKGFHSGGVACTLKHFPGHGDTNEDSHYGSAYVDKTLEELREEELLPFQAGIDAGADAVMVGHMTLRKVDDQPVLFSYKIVTELLREEMGFDGVVVTDALQMQAVADDYGDGEIAVKAVKAGVDLLLCPNHLDEAAGALLRAVESGEISEERLDESVLRILRLKNERGIL